jgi:hypothetical protein
MERLEKLEREAIHALSSTKQV